MIEKKHKKEFLFIPVFVGICFIAPFAGQLLSGTMPNEWYSQLNKPSFNPPNWLFGPVWTALYICMGLAAWAVWRNRKTKRVVQALAVFSIQLILNASWSPVFFGLHKAGLAFAVILALWLAILLTTYMFFRISRFAGWLMIPYLGWVSFATILNGFLWRLNI
jgi:tryptophan-rich sensory protein